MKVIILIVGVCLSIAAYPQFKLYEKGFDSYTAGKYDDAIQNFSEYLKKYTRDKSLDVEVFYLRALAYYKTGKFDQAIPDFEETILLDHDNKGNIYWFKAKCNDKTGAFSEAIEDYDNAIRMLGSNSDTKAKLLYERSLIYSKKGDATLAYQDLKNASALKPDNNDVKKELEKYEKQGMATRSTPDPQVKKTEGSAAVTQTKTDNKKTKDAALVSTPKKTVTPPEEKKAPDTKDNRENESAPVTVVSPLAEQYKDERRLALVIGNSNYPKEIGVLKNPVNDATDIAQELENSNFQVHLLTNATYGQIRAALLKFKEKLDAGDREKTVALFYFAGHGLQFEDENYLVPVDASVQYEDDIARYCFPVQRMVLANMERSNARMNIVILDACRNNPFPSLNRSAGGQGLGEMRRARGSFIAYATAPGSVASDGRGRNGLYTQELLRAMRKPGLTIEQVFKEVRANVLKQSGDKQNTWDSSNIIGEFYFKF
jgi:tetratricopeptide (TPR) repeat protein